MKNLFVRMFALLTMVVLVAGATPKAEAQSSPEERFAVAFSTVGSIALVLVGGVASASGTAGYYLLLSVGAPEGSAIAGGVITSVTTVVPLPFADKKDKPEVLAAVREDAAAYIAANGDYTSDLMNEVVAAVRAGVEKQHGAAAAASVSPMQVAEALVRLN